MPIEPPLAEWSVLLGIADTKLAAALCETIRAEGVDTKFFSNMDEARTLIAKYRPSLAIVEHDPPRIDGMEMCRAIREQENDREHQLPVIMVAAQENQAAGASAAEVDRPGPYGLPNRRGVPGRPRKNATGLSKPRLCATRQFKAGRIGYAQRLL
jgi:CheY-like chemotaxis protein